MPDERDAPHRSGPPTDTPALACYEDDLLRIGEITPKPDNPRELVESKLNFVVRAARRVARCQNGASVDVLDLIQEGNVALLQAVEDWVAGRTGLACFYTFTYYRVYRALRRHVAAAERENGRLYPLDECEDEPGCGEASGTLDLFDAVLLQERRLAVKETLTSLPPRQRLVVALRLGFVDGQEKTYEEIGTVLGVSRTRASQLMAAARKKLRHPLRSGKLRDFI